MEERQWEDVRSNASDYSMERIRSEEGYDDEKSEKIEFKIQVSASKKVDLEVLKNKSNLFESIFK